VYKRQPQKIIHLLLQEQQVLPVYLVKIYQEFL
jgi:hypothetical protein